MTVFHPGHAKMLSSVVLCSRLSSVSKRCFSTEFQITTYILAELNKCSASIFFPMLTFRITPYLLSFLFLFSTGLLHQVSAQTYTISDDSRMTVYGSANVTDWDAEVKTIRGEVKINNPNGNDWSRAEASWFESVSVTIPVGDIDADSRRMNRNMHEYLKEDDYPEITYSLVEAEELASLGNPGFQLTVRGTVNAAGESREIIHDVEISEQENGNLVISGSQDLKMTDFGIDPPTAMLGSVRSRDEMTIEFELVLEK